ncbi:SDR family NAD(P)-dependent oxidoreductase [Nonomuraea sp. NBC_00507]|uniref:SDR family NAD(P)-dependent oxidoreductase n=1 Tax=Nonomuraea sp. NBC_00507 TaxID=2976002 RepID=UPI002E1965B8
MVEILSYGPWAVVTGASSGIGKAFAEHLAAAGLDLVLAARSTDKLHALGEKLSHHHGIAHRVVTVDLSQPAGASAIVKATEDLDVGLLVSNAGGGRPGRLLDQSLDDLHDRLTLNAVTHLDLVHAFAPRLVARGHAQRRGGIVLVSAHGALQGLPNMAHESAAKAYVLNLGEALHHELAPAGVTVTVMLPGNVDTPIIEAFGLDRSSLPIRPQPADRAVAELMAAFLKGRTMHIPGRLMRVMTRLMPRAQAVRMNGRMLGRAARNLLTDHDPARAQAQP